MILNTYSHTLSEKNCGFIIVILFCPSVSPCVPFFFFIQLLHFTTQINHFLQNFYKQQKTFNFHNNQILSWDMNGCNAHAMGKNVWKFNFYCVKVWVPNEVCPSKQNTVPITPHLILAKQFFEMQMDRTFRCAIKFQKLNFHPFHPGIDEMLKNNVYPPKTWFLKFLQILQFSQ